MLSNIYAYAQRVANKQEGLSIAPRRQMRTTIYAHPAFREQMGVKP
jgi:hypothetical protein